MPDITITTVPAQQCTTTISIDTINSNECVGTSLSKITTNFSNIETELNRHCTSINNNSSNLKTTTEELSAAINALGVPPVGAIIMYDLPSGEGVSINGGAVTTTIATIRTAIDNGDAIILGDSDDGNKWKICNGHGTTPDLRGRFIVAAGTLSSDYYEYQSEAGGGVATGGAASVTLTIDQIPSHSHSASGGGSNMTSSGTIRSGSRDPERTYWTKSGSGSVSVGSTGGGQSHENRPPYSVLLFIQRIS